MSNKIPLKYKKCTECKNSTVFTLSTNPICRPCIKTMCCMANEPNVLGYKECNITVDHVIHGGRFYCMGHFNVLKQKCRICSKQRTVDDKLSFDMWFYCDKHKPSMQSYKKTLYKLFRSVLDYDTTDIIVNKLEQSIIDDIHTEHTKMSPKEHYKV